MIGYQLSIQARRYPESIALVYGARQLSYLELDQRARRLAAALQAQGIRSGDRVAVLLHNCPAFFELMFACATLGAVFVPINFRLVAREIAMVLDACTPKMLFAGSDFAAVLASLETPQRHALRVIPVDDRLPEIKAAAPGPYEDLLATSVELACELPPVNADAVLMLLHSSGTTGLPKGIMFSHATTLACASAKIIDFALDPADVTVVFGPLFHAGPLMDLALPLLLRGGRVVLGASRHFNPQQLLQTIDEHDGTVIPIYPTMLRRVLETPPEQQPGLRRLRLIITGGEAAPIPVIEGVHERFPGVAFINNYGSTEGGPVTTFLPSVDSRRKMGSVGKESFSVQVRIVDEAGRECAPDAVGELVVRSPFVCLGYWNRPSETAEQYRDGWWFTGDLARRDPEGDLWIVGRSKDMIKTGTENVYPIEVEQVIAELSGVVEVGVIGVPDPQWGESVVAYVVATPQSGLDVAAVIAHCQRNLASYKKPRRVKFVENLPRGTTNKVAKNVLRDWSSRDEGTSH